MVNFIARFEEAIGWYPAGMSKEEKKLVRKIDILVLSYACLSFFTKFMDISALSKISIPIVRLVLTR
jgi:ACS family pantothenate transporter-like MFS transporter